MWLLALRHNNTETRSDHGLQTFHVSNLCELNTLRGLRLVPDQVETLDCHDRQKATGEGVKLVMIIRAEIVLVKN